MTLRVCGLDIENAIKSRVCALEEFRCRGLDGKHRQFMVALVEQEVVP
jgi:hypothetical protein